jgi:hypothetical protein
MTLAHPNIATCAVRQPFEQNILANVHKENKIKQKLK